LGEDLQRHSASEMDVEFALRDRSNQFLHGSRSGPTCRMMTGMQSYNEATLFACRPLVLLAALIIEGEAGDQDPHLPEAE